MNFANTILAQIHDTDHWALGAWGAHCIDKTPDTLFMRVKGTKFQGEVAVHYHYPSDTYIVRAYLRGETSRDEAIIAEKEDVHAEELVGILDSIIG